MKRRVTLIMLCAVATMGLSGCLVAGYSSAGGPFIWPGGLGLVVVLLLLFFFLRRRR